MTERAVNFIDFSEIENREKFSRDNLISVGTFGSLIGPYHFRDTVYCQVERNDSKCNHAHNWGWLARRNDGQEAIIGQDCANKYFNANQSFQSERRRIDSEIRVDSHLSALTELLRDKPALIARVGAASQRMKRLREAARGFQNLFTHEVKRRLSDMVKTGNHRVHVEVRVTEKDDDGKEKVVWRQREIGTLQGVDLWDESETTDLYQALNAIRTAADEAIVSRSEKERNLKLWRETIESLPRCEQRVAALEKALAALSETANVAMLSVLGRSHVNRTDLCAQALKCSGDPKPSHKKTDALAGALAAWVKQQTGGLESRGV